jgi:hypothetical protein
MKRIVQLDYSQESMEGGRQACKLTFTISAVAERDQIKIELTGLVLDEFSDQLRMVDAAVVQDYDTTWTRVRVCQRQLNLELELFE